MNPIFTLHEKAVQLAKEFKKKESELLGILIEVEKTRCYRERGYTSLRSYCLAELGLSESVTDNFVAVARKSIEVPEMEQLIESGKLHLTNAKQIARAMKPENQEALLEKEQQCSSRELEREICKWVPDQAKREVLKPISERLARLILKQS